MIVIGNGESRKSIRLNDCDYKIGCNAAYRDLEIDTLVCVDKRMVKEALSNNFTNTIYTRSEWAAGFNSFSNVKSFPSLPYKGKLRQDDPWHWGSGPYAVYIAALQEKEIKMIGFDLYSENNKINNVYKDTPNYEKSSYKAIDPSYWIYQIAKIFESFPNNNFTIYNTERWQIPALWKKNNVKVDNLDKFM